MPNGKALSLLFFLPFCTPDCCLLCESPFQSCVLQVCPGKWDCNTALLLCHCCRACTYVSILLMLMVLQVGPVLEAMEDILAALLRSLDGRVYVAVGRGLWDFTSKDIYDYVDSLQEGKENKVSAICCTFGDESARQAAAIVYITLLGALLWQDVQLLMLFSI